MRSVSDRSAPGDVKVGVKEGGAAGLVAGVAMLSVQVATAVIAGDPPLCPLRLSASVFIGEGALSTTNAATALLVGAIGHFALAAVFGMIYGIFSSALTRPMRSWPQRQAIVGTLYGVLIWIVNLQVLARLASPWLLDTSQSVQLATHALAYGLPLGLIYAASERCSGTPDAARKHSGGDS
jgi:hypothetical protein